MEYSITCNCGQEMKGADRRGVEGRMWHHAVQDHADMVRGMSAEQMAGLMRGWDGKFAEQEKAGQ